MDLEEREITDETRAHFDAIQLKLHDAMSHER